MALLLACLGVAAAGAQPRPDSRLQPPSIIDPDLDPRCHFTPDEPMVGFFIGMEHEDRLVPMRVPIRYFKDRADHTEGAVHGAQLIPVTVPEFEPIRRAEEARRNREGLPWDWMHSLVNDQLPPDETLGLHVRVPLSVETILADPELENPIPDWRDLPAGPGPFGLTRLEQQSRLRGGDFLFHLDEEGDLAGWMRCSVREVRYTQNERSQHVTRLSGLDVSVSFRRTELPNWRTIHDNVARFLTCATSDPI